MITMTEIAKLTGVSQATVSRVLSGNSSVKEDTKQRVLACAREHNYQPNFIAQSLVGSKTYLLGMVVTDISNPYFAELVKATEKYAGEAGYSLILFNTDYDRKKEEKYFSILSRYQVDGIITVPITEEVEYGEQLKSYGIPVVAVTRNLSNLDSIFVSHFNAGKKVAEHLLANGYNTFAFIGKTEDQKEDGFIAALEEKGMDTKEHYLSVYYKPDQQNISMKDDLRERIREWLKKEQKTSGIGMFASNDVQGVQVLELLKEMKMQVPDDVAVVGFDNTYLSGITSPGLTSVSQPIDEIARLAVERMAELLEGKDETCVRYQLETRIVTRGSTVKVRKL